MTKIDLIENLYEKLNLPKRQVGQVVEFVFDIIKETLQREDKLMVSGFGDFIIRNKKAKRGRNVQTGSDILIRPRRVLTFKPGLVFRARLNQSKEKNISSAKKPLLQKTPLMEIPRKEERRRIRFMAIEWKLKKVQDRLIKDLKETTLSFRRLGKKYGVSGQAIFGFCDRKRVKRPKRQHTPRTCPICRGLIRIAKKPRSDFISSQTIKEKLRIGLKEWIYHIHILRKNKLVSKKFGRLHSKKVEIAYQVYFKKRLPLSTIGRQVGVKNFHVTIRDHKASGWDVPAPLFVCDGNARRTKLKMERKNRGNDKK